MESFCSVLIFSLQFSILLPQTLPRKIARTGKRKKYASVPWTPPSAKKTKLLLKLGKIMMMPKWIFVNLKVTLPVT